MVAAPCLPSGKYHGPETVFNGYLRYGVFSEVWKIAHLVLLHKGAGKPVTKAPSFSPLCMTEKCLELLILWRLAAFVGEIGGLALN